MGYFPIFLYLAGFLLLFIMVVSNHFVIKKKQYLRSLEELVARLQELNGSGTFFVEPGSLEEVERHYQSLKVDADQERLSYLNRTVKPLLAKTKLQLYWYNKLILTKPYS